MSLLPLALILTGSPFHLSAPSEGKRLLPKFGPHLRDMDASAGGGPGN